MERDSAGPPLAKRRLRLVGDGGRVPASHWQSQWHTERATLYTIVSATPAGPPVAHECATLYTITSATPPRGMVLNL